MPATKKTTTKKVSNKPKAVTVKKRPTTAKRTTRSSAKRANNNSKKVEYQSFELYRDSTGFISSRITLQTVYWSIFAVAILIVGLKVLDAQLDVIDAINDLTLYINR